MSINALSESNQDLVVELQDRLLESNHLTRFIFMSAEGRRERYWQEPGLLLMVDEPAETTGLHGFDPNDHDLFVEEVLDFLAAQADIPVREIKGSSRSTDFVPARHAAFALLRQHTNLSFPNIGDAIGRRDHTTVMNGVHRVEASRQALESGELLSKDRREAVRLVDLFNEHFEELEANKRKESLEITPEAMALAELAIHTCLTPRGLFEYQVETTDDPEKLSHFGQEGKAPIYLFDTRRVYDELVEQHAASALGLIKA